MDEETLFKVLQILRLAGHGVTATYLIFLFFHRERDKWLYLVLFTQFAAVVIWGGLGVIDPVFEYYGRPWQTVFVIATVFVIVRDMLFLYSRKQRALRRLEHDIRRKSQVMGEMP